MISIACGSVRQMFVFIFPHDRLKLKGSLSCSKSLGIALTSPKMGRR
jgi:hypothetical protein